MPDCIGVGTAWKCAGGPIAFSGEEQAKVRKEWLEQTITVDKVGFLEREMSAGLILKDGSKTDSVKVVFGDAADEEIHSGMNKKVPYTGTGDPDRG